MKQSIVLALIVATTLVACSKKEEATAAAATTAQAAELPADVQALATTTATVATSTSPSATTTTPADANRLEATGEFIAPQTSELAVKQPGRVARILVDAGQRVRAGQPVLVLEADYANLDAQRASADVSRAAAAMADAQRDLARKSELKAKGSVPQATYDRSQATYEQARAAHAAAVASASSARQRIADATLRAPFTGVVVERRADVGERLGDNSVAFVIAQTAPLKLRFDLPERYIDRVREGQTVNATVEPFPNEPFAGKISVVSQVVNPQTRSFFVEALFPNSDGRLRAGLFARVKLEL